MKKKTLFIVIIGVFGLFSFLSGCVNLEKSYPEKRYFILDASREKNVSSHDRRKSLPSAGFVSLLNMRARGLFIDLIELSYESDFYNEFFISPASMFTEEIRKQLAGSGLFKHVVDPSSF